MTKKELKISIDKSMLQQLLSENEEFMKPLIQSVVQEVLEAQMSAALTVMSYTSCKSEKGVIS